jgi:hypothetical protein
VSVTVIAVGALVMAVATSLVGYRRSNLMRLRVSKDVNPPCTSY